MLLQGFTRVLERVCPVQPAAAAATSAIYICSTLIHNLECGLNGMFASHSPRLVLPHLVAFISIRNELLLFAYLYKWLLLVWALTVCNVLINTIALPRENAAAAAENSR